MMMHNLMHDGSTEILSAAEALRLNTLRDNSLAARERDRDADREKLAERVNMLIDQYFTCHWTEVLY